MKAVIPAAGLGTRFLPATKNMPKEMLPLVDKPTIHYVVEEAVRSGCDDILIITGRGKRAIEDYFDASPELQHRLEEMGRGSLLDELNDLSASAEIHYIRQRAPLGLAHAILTARHHVGDEAFAVLLGDDATLAGPEGHCTEALMRAHEEMGGASVVGVQPVAAEDVCRYGAIGWSDEPKPGLYRIDKIVEKPHPGQEPSRFVALGRYVFRPEFFASCAAISPGLHGEYQVADALLEHLRSFPVFGLHFRGERFDTGHQLGWLKTNVLLTLRREDLGKELEAFLRDVLGEAKTGRVTGPNPARDPKPWPP